MVVGHIRNTSACKLTLVDLVGRRYIVPLDGVLYVPGLALKSNGNYLHLLSVPVATGRGCKFEFTQPGDKLWTTEGSVFEMIKSKSLASLPIVK